MFEPAPGETSNEAAREFAEKAPRDVTPQSYLALVYFVVKPLAADPEEACSLAFIAPYRSENILDVRLFHHREPDHAAPEMVAVV